MARSDERVQASSPTTGGDSRADRDSRDGLASPVPAAGAAPPVPPEELVDPALREHLPATERPAATSPSDLADSEAVTGPGLAEVIGPDPADLDEMSRFPGADAAYGGLDGRSGAAEGGARSPGGEPDFSSANPVDAALIDHAAGGRVDADTQAKLDTYAAQAKAAAAQGREGRVTEIADRTHALLHPDQEPGNGPGQESEPALELVSTVGVASGGTKQVWDSEKGEMVEVPVGTKTQHEKFVSESVQMDKAGVSADSTGDGDAPPPSQGSTEDRAPDAGFGGADPWRPFTDQVFEHQRGAAAGGAVDPNPQDDVGGVVIGEVPDDFTDPVAHYEPDAPIATFEVDDVPEDAAPPAPDEEF